jgi:hypothetical protein
LENAFASLHNVASGFFNLQKKKSKFWGRVFSMIGSVVMKAVPNERLLNYKSIKEIKTDTVFLMGLLI